MFTTIFVVKSLKGFGWNNVGSASQTVAHHYPTIENHIEPAMGCDAGPTLNPYWVGRPTSCVRIHRKDAYSEFHSIFNGKHEEDHYSCVYKILGQICVW